MRVLLLFGLLVVLYSAAVFAAGDPSSAASQAWNDVNSRWFSSEEAVSQNLFKPLTSGIPLYTLNGTMSGSAQIQCPGAESALDIIIQPGTTHDLTYVGIRYDIDTDGNPDGSLQITLPVSGVCANGFISCQPGTWSNCHWYQWQAQNVGGHVSLSYTEVSSNRLSGCFCINTFCTPNVNFLQFKDLVLRTLGAGVIAALSAAEPRFGVSWGEIVDVYHLRYFAQNARNCNLNNLGSLAAYGSPSDPEDYFRASAQLSADAQNMAASQASDTESLYYQLLHSNAYTQASENLCTIGYDISVSLTSSSGRCSERVPDYCVAGATYVAYSTRTAGKDCASGTCYSSNCQAAPGSDCAVTFSDNYTSGNSTYPVSLEYRFYFDSSCSISSVNATVTGLPSGNGAERDAAAVLGVSQMSVTCDNTTGTCTYLYSGGAVPAQGNLSLGAASVKNKSVLEYVCSQDGRIYATSDECAAACGDAQCKVNEYTTDQCTSLDSNNQCHLKWEKIFDVNGNFQYTYWDFNPTEILNGGVSDTWANSCSDLGGHFFCSCKYVYVNPFCSFDVPATGSTCNGYVEGPTLCGASCVAFRGTAGAAGGSATLHITLTQEQIDALQEVRVSWCTNTYSSGDCFDDDGGVSVTVNGRKAFSVGYGDCEPCYFARSVSVSLFQPGDNVIIFHNWAGKKPGSGCRHFSIKFLFSPSGVAKPFCRDWWRKQRDYECDVPPQQVDMTRPEHIASTMSETSSGVSYEDVVKNNSNGTWTSLPSQNVDKTMSEWSAQCVRACKVAKWIEPAQAERGYTSETYRKTQSHIQFSYRICEDGSTCPYDPSANETVVTPCTCVNEFNEVISALEAVRLASIDMVCSSNLRRRPP